MQTIWRYVMWAAAVAAVLPAAAFAWTGVVALAGLALMLLGVVLVVLYRMAGKDSSVPPVANMEQLRLRLATRRLRREARREQPRDEHEDYWQ